MWDAVWYVVMVPMVYFSIAWCVVWIVIRISALWQAPSQPRTLRIFPEGKDQDDWNTGGWPAALWDALSMPAIRTHDPAFWVVLILFHVGIVVLFLAHLDLLPQINIMSAKSPHMIGNGFIGLAVTIALLYLLFRRFRTPVREVSVPADYLLLFLLLCIAVSGDIISWGNSWSEAGFVMTKSDFAAYLDSLVRFTFKDPREALTGSHYAVIGVHVLFANLFLIVLPFSKIMHVFFAVPMNRLKRG